VGEDKNKIFRKSHPELDQRFIREHPAKAEILVNSLPLPEQLELVLERRGRERMDLILLSKKSRALVRALPEAELYFTLKEVGEEEALPLLAMAEQRQLTYIFDLEFWSEQALVPERMFRWLDLLKQADEDQFREWLKKVDLELIILILQKAVTVHVVDPDNLGAEPWREKELFTLDDQYYFEIADETNHAIIERLLLQLHDLGEEKFYALVDDARLQVTWENEDTAARVRQGRMEDHGFYGFDEALKIYRQVSPEKLAELEKNPERPGPEKAPGAHFALTLAQELPHFLARGLAELSGAELEEFHHQFARLANKVMAADAMDLTQLDSLSIAVAKVYGCLEIGLESWSGGSFAKAVELLRRQWLEHIFQAGFSQVLEQSKRAQRIRRIEWFARLSEPFFLFGDPDGKILRALVLPRPKFYSGEKGGETAEFRSLSEVKAAGQAVERAELWQLLMFDGLGLRPEKLAELMEIYPSELSFQVVLATALVNAAVKFGPGFEPLTTEELSGFIREAMKPEAPPRKMDSRLKQELLDWFVKQSAGKASEASVRELADSAIVSIEDELGLIQDPEKIMPKFITSLVLKTHHHKPEPEKETCDEEH